MPADVQVRQASTLHLQVPRVDWAKIIAGTKTQLRNNGRGAPSMQHVTLPRPVVLYSRQQFRAATEQRLAVLEAVRREPLGSITPEDLAAEGFDSLKEFRRYWIERYVRPGVHGFNPLAIVYVYTFGLWQPGDRERFADALITHLYGAWL